MFYFNKNSYKQICIVILSSFFIISCGEKSQNQPKKDETVKESSVYNSRSVDKYNDYVSFYNDALDNIYSALENYLKCQDDEKNLKKHKEASRHFTKNISNLKLMSWNRGKDISKNKPAFKELDEAAEELIPPGEELIQLLNTAAKYYDARDYLDDKYEKGIELHTKIWATGKIFMAAYAKFDEALQNKTTEMKNAEMDYVKKTGNAFLYNKILVSILMEKIINEFEIQQLSDKKIDLSKIKPLYDEFNQAQRALREAQENQNISNASMYISSTTNFKKALLQLMEKIEKKESVVDMDFHSLNYSYREAVRYY